MVFEYFIKQEINNYNCILAGEPDSTSSYLLAGCAAMYEATKENFYIKPIQSLKEKRFAWSNITLDWSLLWRCTGYFDNKETQKWFESNLLELMKKVENHIKICTGENKAVCTKFSAYPFWVYYETKWNKRKRYGDIISQLMKSRTICDNEEEIRKISIDQWGELLTSMIDCYELMTEEAYDQRDAFLLSLKRGIQYISRYMVEEKGLFINPLFTCVEGEEELSGNLLIAYTLLKASRLRLLTKKSYIKVAITLLTVIESKYFTFSHNQFYLPNANEKTKENDIRQCFSCMMAYSEYLKIRKEEKILGISNYF